MLVFHWGGCGSGGRAGHLLIGRLIVQSLAAPAKVSFGKILNSEFLLMPSLHECLSEHSTESTSK